MLFFIAWRIAYSKWGRIFKSLRDNVEAVEMSGVDIASCKIKAFTVASIFGTVAGAMYAHYMGYINPSTFNLDLSTNYVVMLMVGGLGSVVGTIFGSAIVTILPEMLRFLGNYYQIVFCSIILLGAIFFPDGWVSAATGLFMKMYQRISGKSYAEGGE
ncbi:MAG: branched-chain amino acid ABC transporter permease [Enterocloster bolteae]